MGEKNNDTFLFPNSKIGYEVVRSNKETSLKVVGFEEEEDNDPKRICPKCGEDWIDGCGGGAWGRNFQCLECEFEWKEGDENDAKAIGKESIKISEKYLPDFINHYGLLLQDKKVTSKRKANWDVEEDEEDTTIFTDMGIDTNDGIVDRKEALEIAQEFFNTDEENLNVTNFQKAKKRASTFKCPQCFSPLIKDVNSGTWDCPECDIKWSEEDVTETNWPKQNTSQPKTADFLVNPTQEEFNKLKEEGEEEFTEDLPDNFFTEQAEDVEEDIESNVSNTRYSIHGREKKALRTRIVNVEAFYDEDDTLIADEQEMINDFIKADVEFVVETSDGDILLGSNLNEGDILILPSGKEVTMSGTQYMSDDEAEKVIKL